MNERRLRAELLDARVPDAAAAEERGLRLVRAAYLASPPALRPRRRTGLRRGLQAAVAIGLIAALISPAGAAVRHWVRDAVEPAGKQARPELTSLPTAGDLLVDSARGPWIVHEDGSKRLLGDYSQSTWSPHGLFVAATAPGQLLAIDPQGEARWSIPKYGSVSDPAWSPDGFRIAYLNNGTLRLIAADGTGDRGLARPVAPVTPAWMPGPEQAIVFAERTGRVRALEVESGSTLFRTAPGPAPTALAWSSDGSRLLIVERSRVRLLDRRGRLVWQDAAPAGTEFGAATFAGAADRVAVVVTARGGPVRSRLRLLGPGTPPTTLLSDPGAFSGLLASPDGRWLLLAWRSADQWIFLDLDHPQHLVAASGIASQFDPGTTAPPAFPELAGWCCP